MQYSLPDSMPSWFRYGIYCGDLLRFLRPTFDQAGLSGSRLEFIPPRDVKSAKNNLLKAKDNCSILA